MGDNQINVGGVWCVYSDCIDCGVRYVVPKTVWDKQRKSGGFHHCSNGHNQGWNKSNSQDEIIRRERDRLKQRLAERDDDIRQEREGHKATGRQLSAQRGLVTRIKNRVGHGVCPCCSRSFGNLQRHMASKHPAYAKSDIVLSAEEPTNA